VSSVDALVDTASANTTTTSSATTTTTNGNINIKNEHTNTVGRGGITTTATATQQQQQQLNSFALSQVFTPAMMAAQMGLLSTPNALLTIMQVSLSYNQQTDTFIKL
jgi:hypothetical protein